MSSDISQSLSIVLLRYLDAILGTYIDVEEYRYLVRVVDHTLSTFYSSRDLISFSRHCSYMYILYIYTARLQLELLCCRQGRGFSTLAVS